MNERQAQGNEMRKINDKCKSVKVRCAMPVNMNVRSHDYERQGRGKNDSGHQKEERW